MIRKLIAKWRQRKLVAGNQPLLGVVPAAEKQGCGDSCGCSSEKPKAVEPKEKRVEVQVTVVKKPAAKKPTAKKPTAKKPVTKPKGKK